MNLRKKSQEEREKKELARLQKEAKRPRTSYYLFLMMVVVTIIYVVDEITSNVNGAMQPYALFDLFHITSRNVNSSEYTHAINTIAPWTLASNLLLVVTPFYKALSDKYGRRIFLMINTIGMGIGMLVVMMSHSIMQYVFGVLLMLFFTPNDIQVLYIMESAPKEKRATYSSFAKGVALISVSLIGVLSRIFLNENNPGSWRLVYLIPVIVAIVIGLGSFFLVQETPVFVDQRLAYLSLSKQEKDARQEESKKNHIAEEGGVFRAIKFIFSNHQLRWIMIAGFFFFATTFYTSYYATVMEGAMSTDMVATALIIYPFFNGLITALSGFFSDHMGRKKVCILLGSLAMVGLLLFVLACRFHWGPIAVGIAYGCSVGGLWSISDTILLTMPAESSPSGMRSSVMGTISVLISLGLFVGHIIFIIAQNFIAMDLLFLLICVPFMALSILILMVKVKETKHVDLDHITADTYQS